MMSTHNKNRDPAAGFTLIEILVAVSISSIMILMMYTAYRTTLHTIKDMTGYAEFYENINLAIFKIDRDIINLYNSRESRHVALVADTNRGSSEISFITVNSLTFSFLGNMQTPYPVSDVREVGYLLIPDKRTTDLNILFRREKLHYDEEFGKGGSQNLLLENVVSIQFEFLTGNDWTDRWDSREHRRYPEAIKVTLKMRNYSGIDEEFSFVSVTSMK